MRVYFSAGEASGDAYGSELLTKLRGLRPTVEAEAIGGSRLKTAGARIVSDSSQWGAIGATQALRVIPRALRGYWAGIAALKTGTPGVFIPIDFGFFNIRLCRRAKRLGWKILYFIPPGSWRRNRQGADLPGLCDEIVTPFPWSAEMLAAMGASVHFYGHPLKEMIGTVNHGTQPGRIALFPGSRASEIDLNLPLLAATLGPEFTAEIAVAPNCDVEDLRGRWSKLAPDRHGDFFTLGDNYGVLKRAEAALVCSGTATLEAALCRCPTIVFYQLAKSTAIEARIVKPKFDFIALPNILLRRKVVPELIQDQATPTNLRTELEKVLIGQAGRQQILSDFEELDLILGPSDAITRTAELILALGDKPTR